MIIKACVFDLDGTLVDTITDIANAGNYALTQLGFPIHPVQSYKEFIGDGLFNLAKRSLPEEHRNDETVSTTLEILTKHYSEHLLDNSLPYDGIPELLLFLQNKDIDLNIVTNKHDNQAKSIATALFPDITFKNVLGARKDSKIKPDPTDTMFCINMSNAKPEDCVIIGDSNSDILTGKNAGLTTVSVTWGFRSVNFLKQFNPDFMFHSVTDLHDFFKTSI